MSIIDRYISREIVAPFLLLLSLLTIIFISFTASIQLREAAAGAIPATAAFKLILLSTLTSMEILLPTSLFFGAMVALSRLQSDLETMTMLSSGVTPRHIMFTVTKLTFVVSLCAVLLSVYARPWAYSHIYRLESEAVSKLDIKAIEPRKFVSLTSTGHVLYAGGVNREGGYLERVFMQHKPSADNASNALVSAREARLLPIDPYSPPILELTDGHVYHLDPEGSRDLVLDFHTLRVPFPEEEKVAKYRRNAIATHVLGQSDNAKDIAEYQWRMVVPAITLLLLALTVPLTTVKPRQSRSGSIALSLLAYAGVFGVTSVIRTAVEQQSINANPGLWLAPVFPAALLLGMSLIPVVQMQLAKLKRAR